MKKVSNYILMLLFLIFSNCISNVFQEKIGRKAKENLVLAGLNIMKKLHKPNGASYHNFYEP